MISLPYRVKADRLPCVRINKKSKVPAVKWKEPQNQEDPTNPMFLRWLAAGNNYAILTGQTLNGRELCVLDLDTPAFGAHALLNLNLPETFVVKSGRGLHLYYYLPANVKLDGRKDIIHNGEHGGDLLGSECLVMGCGSIHPTGKRYRTNNEKKEITELPIETLHKILSLQKQSVSQPEKIIYNSQKDAARPSSILTAANIQIKNGMCCCPFHADNNPSMSINDEKGLVYCFSCAKGYNARTLYRSLKECGKL